VQGMAVPEESSKPDTAKGSRDMSNQSEKPGRLITRQKRATRITHWIWAVSMFFLLLSGLQIFNAHPALYLGNESGFDYDNSVLVIGSDDDGETIRGKTTILGISFETTGILGVSGPEEEPSAVAFPAWSTIPSTQDLATGRVVHFFFAWIFVATMLVWLIASLRNRHLRKDLLPTGKDVKNFIPDIISHLKLKLLHEVRYSPLQKLAYGGVLFVLFPLIILTGLCMSPGMNAIVPWLPELFGGRQSARTLHFVVMVLLVLFFVVHMAMVLLAGPFNEIRSIITGTYRLSPRTKKDA
jgi:thiosulfate reductase cytochrome b subunit